MTLTDRPQSSAPDVIALLLETATLDDFLQALAGRSLELAPHADGCGVTIERQGRPVTVSSAGASATKLDEAQYGQDDGPCLQAMRTGRIVSVTDTLSESRWGDYPAYAAACGARSSLSLPIAPHTDSAGALNLYAPVPGAFADTDLAPLKLLAAQATGAIALAQRLSDAQEFATDLQTALRSRTVIDQAMGVIMGQQRCTAEKAFDVLRAASQHRNIKLRELCAELIASITGQPPASEELHPRRP
ncbi:putative transcription antitermination regulator [Actinacidiphila reveromycinica]|uniref:Putative transcription antitermination regulator n=1 Tax=Actinacidiphila reveromycinica TaxID=659352 RepID=A0A7U3WGW2_9ACTN|nr:GAF and ANTAR domain-containing protein [Streptomyces sp. SN-593]BBA95445.1 putative transcription antitermination regulator [Streptomyces sp. SN-593]